MKWNFCPECGGQVHFMFVDDIIKSCNGRGSHTIGWNGQLWIPAIRDFCIRYGLNREEIEIIRKRNEEECRLLLTA
jgi:hypothetical protein